MLQKALKEKTQLTRLQTEVKLLRSFVIGLAGRDEEGEYKPEFVKKTLEALQEKPISGFKDKKTFLQQIHKSL